MFLRVKLQSKLYLKFDLYGTTVLLKEVGKVIKLGGRGITISSQSGYRMPALTPQEDEQLACTPTEKLLDLEILKPKNLKMFIAAILITVGTILMVI